MAQNAMARLRSEGNLIGPDQIADWIDRHASGLVLFARQWCRTPEDVVQEAFVALARLDRPPDDPAAWLYQVVRRGAINAGVAAGRRQRREARVAEDAPQWFEPPDNLATSPLDPDLAQAALATLPDDERAVIVAHLWGNLGFSQIGQLLGTTRSTVHRRYQSGLIRLRDRLGALRP